MLDCDHDFELAISQEEQERRHLDTLQDTGFWGKQGAGCLFLAKATSRFLISHRSLRVEQPSTGGTWGGALDDGETPKQGCIREVREEARYKGKFSLIPMFVFTSGSFKYHNFLAIIDEEFDPKLDWETQGYRWVDFGKWPKPMHTGLQALLKDSKSLYVMKSYAQEFKMSKAHATILA